MKLIRYPEFFKIVSQYPKGLDVANYIETKLTELESKENLKDYFFIIFK